MPSENVNCTRFGVYYAVLWVRATRGIRRVDAPPNPWRGRDPIALLTATIGAQDNNNYSLFFPRPESNVRNC